MIKINLLPKDARKRVGLTERIVLVALVLVTTFTFLIMFNSYLNGRIEEKEDEIVSIKKQLDELQRVIDEIEQFEQQRAALEQKLRVIEKLEKEQQIPVHLLDEVYMTLEEDLWLRGFLQDQNNKLTIIGSALSNPVVSNYIRRLQKSEYFSDVTLEISQIREVGGQEIRDFTIRSVLSPPQEETEETETQQ